MSVGFYGKMTLQYFNRLNVKNSNIFQIFKKIFSVFCPHEGERIARELQNTFVWDSCFATICSAEVSEQPGNLLTSD